MLQQAKQDSTRVRILDSISAYLFYKNADSQLVYAKLAYKLRKSAYTANTLLTTTHLGAAYDLANDYENAVKYNYVLIQSLDLAQKK